MLNYQFPLKLLTLMLCLASASAACAMSSSEAEDVEKAADKLAIANDFKSAFRVIREMIEKAEADGDAASAQIGYRFLERELIADEALSGITQLSIAGAVCKNGFDKGMSLMDEMLHSKFAATAEESVIAEKTALLNIAKVKYGAPNVDTCQQQDLIADAELEKQRLLELRQGEKLAARSKLAPSVLHSLDNDSLCVNYGDFLRGSPPFKLEGE